MAFTRITASFAILLTSCIAPATADSDVFLASREGEPQWDLLQELESVVGRDHREATESRVARLEHAMRHMYEALPKDDGGLLGATGVRYMLRRLFVQRHGWFVQGLESGGEAWNSSSPTDVVGAHLGDHVENIFEQRLYSHGFTLHQAAVLAATLESFVHMENVQRFEAAHALLGFSQGNQSGSESQIAVAMRAYMLLLMRGANHSEVTSESFKKTVRSANRVIPFWGKTKEFLETTRSAVLEDDEDASAAPASWGTALKVLERVGESYGRWQDTECHIIKKALVDMDTDGNGRVALQRFYDTSDLFVESVDYLRLLGALDESDMSVIIPNYINGPNNCVAASRFYSVCCIDQCDVLLGHLEDQLAAPSARPGLITQLVSALPSDTVSAPRQLDETLIMRLHDIAAHHGGEVPLHSRLFAQWMHHAYPRECVYPHMSGATKPMTQEQYMKHTGKSSVRVTAAEKEWLKEHVATKAAAQKTDEASTGVDALPAWSAEEELFVGQPSIQQRSSLSSMFKIAMLVAAAGSMLLSLVRMGPKTLSVLNMDDKWEKAHYV